MNNIREPDKHETVQVFYWLDDDPNRVSTDLIYQIENPEIDTLSSIQLVVIGLKQANIPVEVASLIQTKPKASLVIIDHVLNGALQSSIMKEGSSIAATVRGAWPDVPIVGVSAIFNTKADRLSRVFEQEYIELFDFSELTHDIPSLHAISSGFRDLCEACKRLVSKAGYSLRETIADLLNCPVRDREDLASILPSEFKGRPDSGTEHLLARWIWHHLTERPGLLYDSQYAAVLLGLSNDGFSKVAQNFEDAKYTGVFASTSRTRWWKSLLQTRLLELVPTPKFVSTIARGRMLPGITSADYSQSYFSEDPEPDTLAAADEVSHDLHPERIRYTVIHPSETLVVGFEPRRIFKSA